MSMFWRWVHWCRPLREAVGHDGWVLPLVHGFWQQRQLALFGRTLTLTLVARRSRQVGALVSLHLGGSLLAACAVRARAHDLRRFAGSLV